MNFDTREDILEYLFALLQSVSGIVTVWRNRGNLPEKDPQTGASLRPAIILLDGKNEIAMKSEEVAKTKAVKMVPAQFVLSPEIFIVIDKADTRDNTTLNGNPYPVGRILSEWCRLIRGTIENDSHLISILTPNGQMVYTGFETDMRTGSTIGLIGPHGMVKYDFYYFEFPPHN